MRPGPRDELPANTANPQREVPGAGADGAMGSVERQSKHSDLELIDVFKTEVKARWI
jgi:hypothetical protein